MSNIPISSLPIAVSLSGSEAVPLVQAGTTKTATVSLINSANPANIPTGGILGQALVKTSSANYATAWQTVSGLGTVQSVATNNGLTGGTITVSGTIGLASIATGNVLAYTSGGTGVPVATTPSLVLDVIGSTQGDVLYRGASGWAVLPPSTSGFILTTQGASSNPIWSAAGSGSVTSVGLSLPGIFSVTGSPVTTAGTLTATLGTQAANAVWAGPTTGAASAPTFRALVGADLPNPSAASLGGIQSTTGASNQWIASISTAGVPSLSQPAFSNISGTVSASQLPNPTASTLGGVQSFAAVSNQFLTQISTSGVVSAAQPAFSNLSGTATLAQLPTIGNNTILSNISGGSSTPLANGLSAVIDSSIGSTQGDVLYRNASSWTVLAPGTNGQVLTSGGAAANPTWTTVTGTGTVTSVATNNGLTGGAITTTGTIGLATIATGNVLAYTGAGSGVPVATTPTAILDVIASTEGDILYRGASNWAALAPGTNGQFLQTAGAGSTPAWANAVTSIATNGGLTGGTVTTTGTLAQDGNYSGWAVQNCTLAASVSGNVLTVAMKDNAGNNPSSTSPCNINYRNVTASTGSTTLVQQTSALSISTFATGATLGSVNNTAFRFWVVVFNNSGTNVMALINCSTSAGVFALNEGVLVSSTAISGSATSAGVFYTPNGTTVTSKSYRILGYIEYNSTGLATAGTYASGPNFIQTFGPGVSKPGDEVQKLYSSSSSSTALQTSQTQTNLAQAISPTSAANPIEILAVHNAICALNDSGTLQLSRGTSPTLIGNTQVIGSGTASVNNYALTNIAFDIPNTTSSTNYVLFGLSNTNNGCTAVDSKSTIKVTEIMG